MFHISFAGFDLNALYTYAAIYRGQWEPLLSFLEQDCR